MADEARAAEPSAFTRSAFFAIAFTIGLTAFGGGFAVIALLKQRVVDRHRWMTEEEFASAVGVVAALPGTNAANLLTIIGARRAGAWTGVAGCGLFLLPGITAILLFAVFYDRMRGVPGFGSVLEGITAAVVGVIAAVADELRPTVVRTGRELVMMTVSFVLLATHAMSLLEVVLFAGTVGLLADRAPRDPLASDAAPAFLFGTSGAAGSAAAAAVPGLLVTIFGAFAKISLATFGGGIAMLPAVEREVAVRGWVPPAVLADSIAFAQITPGPIANCATFLGYRIAGAAGALAATLGVFLPPLFLSLLVARRLAAVENRRRVRAFLRGVSVAVVGVIAAAAYAVYRVGVHGAVLTVLAIVVFMWRRLRPKDNTLLTIGAGALVGVARALIG